MHWLRQLFRNSLGRETSGEMPPPPTLPTIDRLLNDPDFVRGLAQRLINTPRVWGDPARLAVGRNCHLVNTLFNVSSGTITVGDDTFFGHDVSILTGTHHIERTGSERQDYPTEGRDIVIGKGVWIATNSTVLGPCMIGDDVVVAAGAVVVGGELEAGAIYGGVPAKRIGTTRRNSVSGFEA